MHRYCALNSVSECIFGGKSPRWPSRPEKLQKSGSSSGTERLGYGVSINLAPNPQGTACFENKHETRKTQSVPNTGAHWDLMRRLPNPYKYTGDLLRRIPNPYKDIGDLMRKLQNLYNYLGDLMRRIPNPYEDIGDLMSKLRNPYKSIGDLMRRIPIPYKDIGGLMSKLRNPCKCLGDLMRTKSIQRHWGSYEQAPKSMQIHWRSYEKDPKSIQETLGIL